MKINKLSAIIALLALYSCAVSPGMYMDDGVSSANGNYVEIESINKKILIQEVSAQTNFSSYDEPYKIGEGDWISVTIWGLPDIFPIVNINPDQNARRVDSNGNIYFPYVGEIKAMGKTQSQLRNDLTVELSENFTNPQLDVSIVRFNSQKIYLLGEVTKPSKLNITDVPLSLSDALGEVLGLNTNTSSGSEVYVIRQSNNESPEIFRANLSSPTGFLESSNFYLRDNDIVYVNASGTTRWNRIVSQFFPFSTFLNSIDNLTND